jgi:transposase
MARINCDERVLQYSKEFKVMVVRLTETLSINAADIAEVLSLHPVMVYRWRQEFREGKLVFEPTRKVSMTLNRPTPKPPSKKQITENERLKKEVAHLRKENDLLKKWQQYLAEVKQSDLGS